MAVGGDGVVLGESEPDRLRFRVGSDCSASATDSMRSETLSSVPREAELAGPWGSGILRALGARHPGSNPGGPTV